MNKKTLIACIVLLVLLLAGIATAVVFLYSGSGSNAEKPAPRASAQQQYPLLGAVPSDAAMLMCFSNMEDGVRLFSDTTKIFGTLVEGAAKRGFRPFIDRLVSGRFRSLEHAPMTVSLHYSGDLVPLLVLSAPSDTTADVENLLAAADSARMSSRFLSSVLLVSPSETLVKTAVRHLDGGLSILDKDGFPEALESLGGDDALFFSNVYAGKLFSAWLNRPYSQTSEFFSSLAQWSAFSLPSAGNPVKMKAAAVHGSSTAYFFHVPTTGETKAASVLPASTFFAVDLPVSDMGAWTEAYRKYLDANKKLGRYKSGNNNFQKSLGLTAEQWAQRLDIKEVAKAVVLDGEVRRPLLYIRPGKADADLILRGTGLATFKEYKDAVLPFAWKGMPSLLFGGLFNLPDDSMFTWKDGWMVIGDEKAVGAVVAGTLPSQDLRSFLSDYGLDGRLQERGLSVYVSMTSAVADEVFRPEVAAAWKHTLAGTALEPAVLNLSDASGQLTVDRAKARTRRTGKAGVAEVAAEVPVDIAVPQGPFKVRNSGTGKDNTFSQAPNLALQLRDENGKTLWSLPFKSTLCGYVEGIDYYANGKIQFLFAAGSKLYLVDRLGRMVSGFPAELGKEVLLGPGVYDFTGAHGYTAMILHKDNTIGMYDLHGKVREGWLGISPETQITALPQLVTAEGKKYWVIRTAGQPVVYGFYGGEPVGKGESRKVLKTLDK
ncbi:MAG: hypothetical protein IJ578_00700 [Bacteroidales bacterium]|nr:hypothetical protein [Bacteroidales bacterium]